MAGHRVRMLVAMARKEEGPLPEGLRYLPGFLAEDDERALLQHLSALAFGEVRMHGVTARRRTLHFGWDYGYSSWRIAPTVPVPDWLLPLRERVAALIQQPAVALEEVLLSEYPEGAGIGWHRDAPMFGPAVVGISLGAPCRMRFQRGKGEARETASLVLERRSAYVLAGPARSAWQHSIPGAPALRHSITFRTLREPARQRALSRDGLPQSSGNW